MKNLKACIGCKQTKPVSEFCKHKRYKDGLNCYCRECDHARNKLWRDAHLERRHDDRKKWQLEHPEQVREKKKREYLRAREQDLTGFRLKVRIQYVHIRARRAGCEGSFTIQEWLDLCAKYGNQCLVCGEEDNLQVDHIVPLSEGGANTIDNIQPLCISCNARKGVKTIDYRSWPSQMLLTQI